MKSKTMQANNDKMNYVKYLNLSVSYQNQSEKIFVIEWEKIFETKITALGSLRSVLREFLDNKKINTNSSIQ